MDSLGRLRCLGGSVALVLSEAPATTATTAADGAASACQNLASIISLAGFDDVLLSCSEWVRSAANPAVSEAAGVSCV